MICVMSLLVVGLGLLNNIVANDSVTVANSIIPSKAEQANLLLNVQEVFEKVKVLTEDEAHSTNVSVVQDIELMVKRAEYILDLLQQITQLRLSCDGNSVCSLDARPVIQQLTQDGKDALRNCTLLAVEDVAKISNELGNVTTGALDRGQILLDDLGACSKKNGLGVISCYRKIIATDVVPVKEVLLEAVDAHRVAHYEGLDIRKVANSCVDETVSRIRDTLEKTLVDGMRCNLT